MPHLQQCHSTPTEARFHNMAIGRVPGATGIQPSIVTAKGDLIVATASGSVTNQAVGSNNQVLTADSAQADGVKWANGSAATLTTTGDLLYASAANTPARLGIGSTGQVLTVSGGVPTWAAGGGGSVARVWCNRNTASISAGNQAIAWDAADDYDTDGFHDPSSNNSRITIPTGKSGVYIFEMAVVFDGGSGLLYFTFWKNGAAHWGYETTSYSSINYTYFFSITEPMNAGDYMQMYINPAGGRALRGGRFTAHRIGDL